MDLLEELYLFRGQVLGRFELAVNLERKFSWKFSLFGSRDGGLVVRESMACGRLQRSGFKFKKFKI